MMPAQAAQALTIQLTKRGKDLGRDIPMCGVPVVNRDFYLAKLVKQGFKVVIVEQVEDVHQAKLEKRLVKREARAHRDGRNSDRRHVVRGGPS